MMAEDKATAESEAKHQDPATDAPEKTAQTAEPAANPETEVAPETGREAELEAEVATLKDQLLRAIAETENVRRRAQRDREEAIKYGGVSLLRDIIGVADNLERALEAMPQDTAAADEAVQSVLTGVQLIERELNSVLDRHKVERLEPLDLPFDPHLHEAMFELPDPSKPSGTVVQVMQRGYRLHDRLLRPARVAVAKGGPAKSAAAPDTGVSGGDEKGAADPGGTIDTEA